MPRAPITPTIVAGPVGRAPYAAQGVVPVQPQQPGMLVQQGQQLQRLGNALEDVDYVQRVKKAEALATESDAKLAESIRNQNSDFGKKEGRDAVDGFESYEKALRESATKMLAGVQDPIAQQAIRESSEKRIQQSLNWAVQHRDKQQETWLKGSVTAAMQGSVEDYKTAVANGDPDASRFFRTAMLYQSKLDAMNGLDDNQKRINTLAATTMLHGGAVDGMLERNEFGKAAAYLQQNKGEIAQDFYDARRAVAARGAVRDVGYSLAAAVMQEAGGDEFKALERLEQERQAGKIDADTTAAAEARVRMLANDARAKRAEQTANVLTEGEAHILGGGMLSDRPDLYEGARKSGVLPQLLRLEQSRKTDTNPVALAEALSLPDEALAKVTRQELVVRYWGQLSRVDLNSVLERRDSAARRIQDGTSGSANVLDQDDLIKREFMRYRAPKASTFERAVIGQERQFQAFRDNLQEQVDAERKAGKPVTKQRIRELAETVGADMVYLEAGGAPMPRLMLTDAEEMEAGVEARGEFVKLGAIPDEVLARIMQIRREAGYSTDFAGIANYWVGLGKPKLASEIKRKEAK